MIAVTVVETAALALLSVLVVGLLRSYATILNRLHALEGGAPAGAPPFRTASDVPGPTQQVAGREEWSAAQDVQGVGLGGEIVTARTVGVAHDTVLVFLSSGCEGCIGFWSELGRPESWTLPARSRLLVVTKDAGEESPSALAQLVSPGLDLVMSSAAWTDFAVPGSPYVVVVDGPTGRVKGEGSGQSFGQVIGLVAQTSADDAHRVTKPAADRERERDVDVALIAAGIRMGDPSLYAPVDEGR